MATHTATATRELDQLAEDESKPAARGGERGARVWALRARARARGRCRASHLGGAQNAEINGSFKALLGFTTVERFEKIIEKDSFLHYSESILLIVAMAKPSAAGLVRKSSEVRACKKNRRNPKKERTVVGGAAETSSADKHFSLELHAP